MREGKSITASYAKQIYNHQKASHLKVARFLTYSHLWPDNFQKQNVQKAIDLFSFEMIAGIKAYRSLEAAGFQHIDETILFMENFNRC
jgi:hypothetical protein